MSESMINEALRIASGIPLYAFHGRNVSELDEIFKEFSIGGFCNRFTVDGKLFFMCDGSVPTHALIEAIR